MSTHRNRGVFPLTHPIESSSIETISARDSRCGNLVVIGAANAEFAKLVRVCGDGMRIVGYLDDDVSRLGSRVMSVEVLGNVDAACRGAFEDASYVISIGDPETRRRIAAVLESKGCTIATLVHPGVDVWGVHIGTGCVVFEGAVIGPNTQLGDHTVVSFQTFLGHDVVVGSHCNVGPGALLNGGCRIEDEVYVGAGAVLLPGVSVGEGATIGVGAVVTRPVEPRCTMMGNPARVLMRGCRVRGNRSR